MRAQRHEYFHSSFDDDWIYFRGDEDETYLASGKYLLFSADQEALFIIGSNEVTWGGFPLARITRRRGRQSDYVLELFYKDDSRHHKLLSKYSGIDYLKYRGWKSDEDTLDGKYSPPYLSRLPSGERREARRPKTRVISRGRNGQMLLIQTREVTKIPPWT